MTRNSSFISWVVDNTLTDKNTYPVVGSYYYTTYPKTITEEFDKFFDGFWSQRNTPILSDGSSLPKTNAYEDKDGMNIVAAIPFAKKEDINITLDPVMNSIKLEVASHQGEDEGREYHIKEISRTSFKRTFVVDKRFDISKAVADYTDGVLRIEIPYAKDSQKTQLTIK